MTPDHESPPGVPGTALEAIHNAPTGFPKARSATGTERSREGRIRAATCRPQEEDHRRGTPPKRAEPAPARLPGI